MKHFSVEREIQESTEVLTKRTQATNDSREYFSISEKKQSIRFQEGPPALAQVLRRKLKRVHFSYSNSMARVAMVYYLFKILKINKNECPFIIIYCICIYVFMYTFVCVCVYIYMDMDIYTYLYTFTKSLLSFLTITNSC